MPLRNYSKALGYELQINSVGERICDIKAEDQIKGTNRHKKIDRLVIKEQKLNQRQKEAYASMKKTGHTREYIVVFETTKAKKECMEEMRGYSHWWSRPHKNMPEILKLH